MQGVMGMLCESCGIPHGISRGNIWYADGSITGRYPPYIKGTFFDVDELNYLFGALSRYMQYDISDIVAAGKYHDTKQYVTAMIERMKESSGGKLPSSEALFQMMLYPIRVWGIADVRIVSIEPEKKVIEVGYPYSIPLLCGDAAGVASVAEGVEHAAEWEGNDEEGVVTVFFSDAYSTIERRIEEEFPVGTEPGESELACGHCVECGAPSAVSEIFAWGNEHLTIIERSTGRRYCFNNTNGVNAVLKLLVSELGEDIHQGMVEIAREYSRDLHGDLQGGVDLEKELGSFPFRGWGVARADHAEKKGDIVTVDNPYSGILVAGRIWGMMEALRGASLRMVWEAAGEGAVKLVFEPA